MRSIRYGFFGEDDAQRLFLRHYLAKLLRGQALQFEEDTTFPLIGGTKDKVRAQFDEACDTGLSRYQQDCFFVGLDLDNHVAGAFEKTVHEMQQKLAARGVSAILLVPVQCIEHWLRYLQWRAENPQSTKNERLEGEERRMAKTRLYGGPKVSTRHSNPIVERIAMGMDIDWLASRSTSFLAFHKQVEAFVAALPPDTSV